jgi:hypothetical protein
MSLRARTAAVAALVCLLAATLLDRGEERTLTLTTFGSVPNGFGALFDLLVELEVKPARSLRPAAELDTTAPIWWLAAPVLCDDTVDFGPDTWSLLEWVEQGGVGVVVLPPPDVVSCGSLAGAPIPRSAGEPLTPADAGPELGGVLMPAARTLQPASLASFAAVDGWVVTALLGERPFVIERRVGAGVLALVADATVFTNRWLDSGDNAVFALDLVRAYGAPRFDEHAHGYRRHESAARYLATSPAAVVFAGLALLAVLYVWRSRLLPARMIEADAQAVPMLDAYVDSMAQLLAATNDHVRVNDAYRDLSWTRLRRHFGMPAGVAMETLVERLRVTGRVTPQALEALVHGRAARDGRAVRHAAGELDRILWEATR